MSLSATPVQAGKTIGRKYRVDRVLGQGGMGVVVAATHLQLRQRVAIKFLHPDASAEALERFAREARAAARIQSEHVARVLDVGELDDGSPFMVMEYLEGQNVFEVLESAGPLTPEMAVDYILQACEALAEAHRAGIVHRDMKPANLFLTKRADGTPLVKLLDFGISKATSTFEPADVSLTQSASFMGTPSYVAPEQILSPKTADARIDIWAVGIILFECLTGKPPFDGNTIVEIASEIIHRPALALSQVRPDVPPGLCDAVARCLCKKPEGRFSDVGELAAALAPFAPPASVSAGRIARIMLRAPADFHPGTSDIAEPDIALMATVPEEPKLAAPRKRFREMRLIFVGAGALFAGMATVFAMTRTPSAPAARPPVVDKAPGRAVATEAEVPPPEPGADAAVQVQATPVAVASAHPSPLPLGAPHGPPSSAGTIATPPPARRNPLSVELK